MFAVVLSCSVSVEGTVDVTAVKLMDLRSREGMRSRFYSKNRISGLGDANKNNRMIRLRVAICIV
jgi:hypothetical protein